MSLKPEQLAKPLKVNRRIQETADAVSFVLEIPAELQSQFRYTAGQFVSFFLTINGETLSRSYSLSSSPLVDSEFKITVKKVEGGRGSTHLCERVREGDVLLTTPPAGHFFKPSLNESGTHYLLFAAGSGITPVFSIMKTVLKSAPNHRVTLVYCNRNEASVIYQKELEQWQKEFDGRLVVHHVLSQPSGSWTGRRGRVDGPLIREVVAQAKVSKQPLESYLCGPSEFMRLVRESLLSEGLTKDQVREEDFGTAVHQPKASLKVNDDWTLIGPTKDTSPPEKIIVQLNGETTEVAAKADQTVLETLLEAGLQAPYSCMDGACMACMAKIQDGVVYQTDPGIFSDDNINACETLTCQAKPLSKVVRVSYDNL